MAGNTCWGIEIGGGAIKALKLEADGDGFKVADFAVINHPKVLSTPELDQDAAVRLALGTLASQHDLSGAQVAISFQGHQSFARFAKLPPVEPKKVPDIVKFEAVQQIPFPLDEVEWDYQTFVSPDSPDIEVGIFAVTRDRISERLGVLDELGMTPNVATISPVAVYNALAVDLEFTNKTPGTIIVDVGTTATDLVIAEAGRVWVRTFRIGGHQFTEAVASQFKLTYSKAEKLKREAEQTKHTRHVFQAMRPVFSDLAQEIQRSIGFYESVHTDANLKRLIGLGSTFKLPGLRKYLKQQLGLDVYRLEQFKKLSVEGSRASEFQASSLNLCTAYGLALQGLERASLKANLMPVPVLKKAMWKKKVPVFGAAAGFAAVAAGAMFIRPVLDKSGFDSAERPAEIQRVVSHAKTLKNEANNAQVTSGAEDDLRASQIVSLLEDRQLYASVMVDVGMALASAQLAAEQDVNLDRSLIAPVFEVSYMDAEWMTTLDESGNDDISKGNSLGGVGGSNDPWGQMYDPRSGRDQGFGFQDDDDDDEELIEDEVIEDPNGLGALKDTPHVRVRLVLQTSLTEREADELVERSIEAWIIANAKRDGVNYELVASSGDEKPYSWAAGAGAAATLASSSSSRDPIAFADPFPRSFPTDPSSLAFQQGGGRGGQPQVQQQVVWTASDLDSKAPLENPAEDRPAVQGSVIITFYVVPGGLADSDSEGRNDG